MPAEHPKQLSLFITGDEFNITGVVRGGGLDAEGSPEELTRILEGPDAIPIIRPNSRERKRIAREALERLRRIINGTATDPPSAAH